MVSMDCPLCGRPTVGHVGMENNTWVLGHVDGVSPDTVDENGAVPVNYVCAETEKVMGQYELKAVYLHDTDPTE